MIYALVKNNQIVQVVNSLPKVFNDGVRDWDIRTADPSILNELGWKEVSMVTKPENTETTTWDYAGVVLSEGVPTQLWNERALTSEELELKAQQKITLERYEAEEAILSATIALMEEAHTDGENWTQPTGAHNAYKLGVIVEHAGKTWENITHANVWEPGVSGWREVVTEGYPTWIQPTGAHDAYPIGAQVTHNGQDWESTAAGNIWEPGVYGWALI